MRGIKLLIIILSIMITAIPAFADDNALARLSYADDRWIALHYFLQAQVFTQNGYESTDNDKWVKGCQLRRSRIILNGQVTKNIDFFMDTDDILIGNQGAGTQYSDSNTSTSEPSDDTVTTKDSKGIFTQDAYIHYRIDDGFGIAVGLMPVPFMHHAMESAISLLGVDYNSTVIPLGSTTNNWRDTGIEIRGIVKTVFDYKFGVFRGQPKYLTDNSGTGNNVVNEDSWPRFTGRVQLNMIDAETGFFYSGNYLGKKNILSFGGGLDYQRHGAKINGKVDDYLAWTGDATIDYKISNEFVGILQGAYVLANNIPGSSKDGQQSGYFVQAGALLYDLFQPVIKYQFWKGDTEYVKDIKTSFLSFGINYFINGHIANIKLEYQTPIINKNDTPGEKKAVLQFQVFI